MDLKEDFILFMIYDRVQTGKINIWDIKPSKCYVGIEQMQENEILQTGKVDTTRGNL